MRSNLIIPLSIPALKKNNTYVSYTETYIYNNCEKKRKAELCTFYIHPTLPQCQRHTVLCQGVPNT